MSKVAANLTLGGVDPEFVQIREENQGVPVPWGVTPGAKHPVSFHYLPEDVEEFDKLTHELIQEYGGLRSHQLDRGEGEVQIGLSGHEWTKAHIYPQTMPGIWKKNNRNTKKRAPRKRIRGDRIDGQPLTKRKYRFTGWGAGSFRP